MNENFDFFGEVIFDEAKYMYEKAKASKYDNEIRLYLHSSILLAFSALEAYINSVCEELVSTQEFGLDLYEKSLLSEKAIELNKGIPLLGKQLKMTRLTDRIELIYYKFTRKEIEQTDTWYCKLCEANKLRNSLVHPKEVVLINSNQVKDVLESILNTVNVIYNAVYGRNVPILNYQIQSVKKYTE